MAKAARPVRFRNEWRVRWLDHSGKRRSDVFEKYEEGERELRRRQHEADEVRRGLRAAPVRDHSFDQLCDYWLANRATQKRSEKDDASIIGRHLLVFPSQVGTMQNPSARVFQGTLHRVLDRAKFPRPPKGRRVVHYIHFHSLRHTFA